MFHRLQQFLRSLLRRHQTEREMQDEMALHLERARARFLARGMSADEARHEALREFGNVAFLQEQARDARGGGWVDALRADCRFALRHFGRTLGTTATMFVVLVGGLTISTLLFTYVHAYAFSPPAGVAREDDLVRVRGTRSVEGGDRVSRLFGSEELREYQSLTAQFSSVAAWTESPVTLGVGAASDTRALEARTTFVTPNFFSVLGLRPPLGRPISSSAASEGETTPVAVIGYTAWDQLFARSPSVVGSVVKVNGVAVTIIGVAPEKFVGFTGAGSFQLWMPLSIRRVIVADTSRGYRVIARVRPGVDLRGASAATAAAASRIAQQSVELEKAGISADVVPLLAANGDPMFDRDVRLMSMSIGTLALLILLVACTNVSALLTGLATARRQEIAIRLSLGAARGRLIRQLLTESALLSALAALASVGLVWTVLRLADAFLPWIPFEVGITWPETTFAFGLALAVGLLFGISPALHATRLGLAGVLRDSAATISVARGRLQRGLVVAQIALTQPLIVLLTAVLLLVLAETRTRIRTAYGDRLVSLMGLYSPDLWSQTAEGDVARQRTAASVRELVVRLARIPGVEAAVVDAGDAPPVGPYVVAANDGGDVARDPLRLSVVSADPGYFGVRGLRMVRGRTFLPSEVTSTNAPASEIPVVIGTDLARRAWGSADALGQRLQAANDTVTQARTLLVVGVIDDPKSAARKPEQGFRIYFPPDTTQPSAGVIVRTTAPAAPLISSIRDVVRDVTPALTFRIRTIGEMEDEYHRRFQLVAAGLTAAGAVALLLSAIGLYAVVAFSVAQRTREIAVRMAVGARSEQIVRRFVVDGVRLSAIGLAIGLPASLAGLVALMDLLDSELPDVALGPVTGVATVCLLVVATVAALLPARRAANIHPAITLRAD
jgi:predicted permease